MHTFNNLLISSKFRIILNDVKQCNYTPQEIEKMLVTAGVQPTLQRISLAKYIMSEANHPTAEEIKEWAEENLDKISQATIYNTLKALTDAGLIRAFRFSHSERVIYDCNTEDHFHFLDEKSGRIYDIHKEDIGVKIEIPKKFKIKSIDLMFKGEVK